MLGAPLESVFNLWFWFLSYVSRLFALGIAANSRVVVSVTLTGSGRRGIASTSKLALFASPDNI